MNRTAASVWDAVVKLIGAGVLTRDNGQSLARYCHGIARWWKLAKWLDSHEDTYEIKDAKGNTISIRRHPNVSAYEKLGRDLLRMEQEFGLTPSARSRVHLSVGESPDRESKSVPTKGTGGPPVLRIAN